ncbi:hypothetical protein ABPG75_006328 [Micractinium tetrahymenae]
MSASFVFAQAAAAQAGAHARSSGSATSRPRVLKPLRPAERPQQAAVAGSAAIALLLASPALALELSYAPSSVKAALEQRDEAMAYQCTGGMFDCDGDRRDFAKKQWADFVAAQGVPERKRAAMTAEAGAEQGPAEQPAAADDE